MAETRNYKQGDVIFNQGDWGTDMYEVVSGKIAIYADYGLDEQELLTELTAGKFFGEMGMIDVMARSATAVAAEDSEVTVISGGEFGNYYKDNPELILAVLSNMTKRLRELSADYLDACKTITAYVENGDEFKQSEGLFGKLKKLMAFGK